MEILVCISNRERNSTASENQLLCPTLTYLLQRFMTITVTFTAPGVHSSILFSCDRLVWKLTPVKAKMLERVWEKKNKIWSWFASVFVKNRYCPQGWHVRNKTARKAGDNQEGFACNMHTISRAQRGWAPGRHWFHSYVLRRCWRLLHILLSPKWSGNSIKCTLGFPTGFPPPPPLTAADSDGDEIRIQFKSSSGEASAHAVILEILKVR